MLASTAAPGVGSAAKKMEATGAAPGRPEVWGILREQAHIVGWRRQAKRSRFLLSYILVFTVLGTAAAIVSSTANPCYCETVTNVPSPYGPLIGYLGALDAEQPIIAPIQRTLWEKYAYARNVPFVGISAMPIAHVAVAVWLALRWRTSRQLGWVFTLYAGVVLIGSVHLGWHYALDGYVSIAGALAIWGSNGALYPTPSPTQRQ